MSVCSKAPPPKIPTLPPLHNPANEDQALQPKTPSPPRQAQDMSHSPPTHTFALARTAFGGDPIRTSFRGASLVRPSLFLSIAGCQPLPRGAVFVLFFFALFLRDATCYHPAPPI